MEFQTLDPNGPVLLIPKVFEDQRGYFMETFRQADFERHCGNYNFVQDNQSKSAGNVLRGLHFQRRHPQGKLVRVISGTVFDVVVDLRAGSPNFGKNYSVILDEENRHIFWAPPGFAHGFYVLSNAAEFAYKCTDYYAPEDEYCVRWDDPDLAISWPLAGKPPILSAKDQRGESFSGLTPISLPSNG